MATMTVEALIEKIATEPEGWWYLTAADINGQKYETVMQRILRSVEGTNIAVSGSANAKGVFVTWEERAEADVENVTHGP